MRAATRATTGDPREQYLGGKTELPIVPLVVNTYYPPNQPRPARCYRLGHALRAAIENHSGTERVDVIASGGLSHFTVDEDLDRTVLEGCASGNGKRLSAIPAKKLNSGSSEIRNWIVAAAPSKRCARSGRNTCLSIARRPARDAGWLSPSGAESRSLAAGRE